MKDSSARLDRMQALAASTIASGRLARIMKTQPFVRQPYDLAAVLMRVRVDAAGGPAAPSSRGFWARVIEGAELPADPARMLRESADDRPIDAAWLAGLTGTGDIRLRAERLDQFAFGQRVFAAASPAEMSDVFVAVRAFRRYRMLMITLERIGIRQSGDVRGGRAPREPPVPAGSRARIRRHRAVPGRARAAVAHANGRHPRCRQDRGARRQPARRPAECVFAVPGRRPAMDRRGAASGAPARRLSGRRGAGGARGPGCRRSPHQESNGKGGDTASTLRRPNASGWSACARSREARRWIWRLTSRPSREG